MPTVAATFIPDIDVGKSGTEVVVRIGDLAERTGVSVRSLRYYEAQGMLSSGRSASGQRHYGADAVNRVLLIRRFFAAGIPSKVIATLMPYIKDPEVCDPPVVLRRLTAERDRIDAQAAELARARRALDGLIKITQEAMASENGYRPSTPPD